MIDSKENYKFDLGVKELKSLLYLIFPYCNTAESFIRIRIIEELITNQRDFDCKTSSLFHFFHQISDVNSPIILAFKSSLSYLGPSLH